MKAIVDIRKRRWMLAACFALCCAGAAFVARAGSGTSLESTRSKGLASAGSPANAAASPLATRADKSEPIQVLKFSLFDAGISPREACVDQGLVAILIEDYTGGTSGLEVERETGNATERTGRVERAGSHWRGEGEMRLSPGRYRVYMSDRPGNQAVIVVEP